MNAKSIHYRGIYRNELITDNVVIRLMWSNRPRVIKSQNPTSKVVYRSKRSANCYYSVKAVFPKLFKLADQKCLKIFLADHNMSKNNSADHQVQKNSNEYILRLLLGVPMVVLYTGLIVFEKVLSIYLIILSKLDEF